MVRNHEAEARDGQYEKPGSRVNSDDASGRCQSVEKPGEAEAECQDEESDRPVGDQFREDEGKFAYRRDVDLFDGPRLFLCDDIQRGHETA